MAFTILVKIHSPDARRTMMCIFFLSIHNLYFYFVVPCIKTFHGTSMQCLHQATLKSTNNRFNQGPFIKSVFSAHEKKKKKHLQKIQKREGAPLPSCQQRTMVAEMKEAINRVCEAGLSRALAGLFNWRRGLFGVSGLSVPLFSPRERENVCREVVLALHMAPPFGLH